VYVNCCELHPLLTNPVHVPLVTENAMCGKTENTAFTLLDAPNASVTVTVN